MPDKNFNTGAATSGAQQTGESHAEIQANYFKIAQQFRVALYLEWMHAKGCTPQDVWHTWLKMPYSGPNRKEILEEMKKYCLK